MEGGYVYDQAWERERERLAGIEALWDPGTARLLEARGVAAGWRCLEIGGGGGATVQWLCERVGPGGRVLATDLDTRFLDAIDHPVLEVRRHDIVADPPPGEAFDLIHARLVLEHLPARAAVIEQLAGLLAPGGTLLLEDYDWNGTVTDPPSETFDRLGTAILGYMTEVAGFDGEYGRRLVRELRRVGLEDVDAEGRARIIGAAAPGADFFRLTIAALADALVERGDVRADEIAEAVAMFEDPDRVLVTPTMVGAWGVAPR